MENEQVPSSAPSIPATPGNFGGFNNKRLSLHKSCNCHTVANEQGREEDNLTDQRLRSLTPPFASLAKMVGAEFIGTFILVFSGTATAILNEKTRGTQSLLGIASAGGLAVMILVTSTAHISGAHFNPAVTIAITALKHFPWKHVLTVPVYIGAQMVASLCASFAVKGIFKPIMSGGVTVPSGGYGQAFAIEFIISFNLMFVVTALATDIKAVGRLAGIAVGGTVMLNVLIAGEITGACMNPVRALGPAIAASNFKGIWIYLTAPILGALSGAGAYSAIKFPDNGVSQRKPA